MSPLRAPLDRPRISIGAFTALEVMLTMRPKPREAMPSTVVWISAIGVSMLASTALIQASRSQSRKLPVGGPPALVTMMSKSFPGPPAAENTASRPASVVMSQATPTTWTLFDRCRSCSTARCSGSALRALMTRLTPSAASALAQPKPRPLLAPQTSAHLPAIPKSMSRSFS